MTKEIPLTRDKVAIVDDGDFDFLMQWKWNAHIAGGKFYAGRSTKVIFMHRVIMNAPKGMHVDHINGNTLDNRRCNLRIATHAENLRNRSKGHGHSSRYKGVSWNKGMCKWQVCIKNPIRNKNQNLGAFTGEADAARAYDAKARELFGDFARLNFPRDGEQAA